MKIPSLSAIRNGDRRAIAKAITLLESTHPEKLDQGQALLEELLPETGKSLRIGITGFPGVGKSTFIEAFGMRLIEVGHRVAVLCWLWIQVAQSLVEASWAIRRGCNNCPHTHRHLYVLHPRPECWVESLVEPMRRCCSVKQRATT